MVGSDMKSSSVVAAAAVEMQRHLDRELPPGLYLVATPIGNLADITLRALSVLARADIILCEDTRHSRTLLSHFGIEATTRPYHDHNAARERPRVLADLAAGRRVALISDAGTPLVSDPGYKLVRASLEAGHRVESLPGPSAALAGLSVAGLPTDAFYFVGFLPPRSAARRARIAELKSVATKFRLAIERCGPRRLSIPFEKFPEGSCGEAAQLLRTFLQKRRLGGVDEFATDELFGIERSR